MPGASFDVIVHVEDEQCLRYLGEMIRRGQDLRQPFKKIMVVLLKSTDKTFKAQGRPTPWQPLSPVTIARRRKGHRRGSGSAMILQDTRRLIMSVTGATALGAIRVIAPLYLLMGTRVDYALTHQEGRGPIPGVEQHVKPFWRKRPTRMVMRTIFIGGQMHPSAQRRMIRPSQRFAGTRRTKVFVHEHRRIVTLPAVPRRVFLLIQDEDVAEIREILGQYVVGD